MEKLEVSDDIDTENSIIIGDESTYGDFPTVVSDSTFKDEYSNLFSDSEDEADADTSNTNENSSYIEVQKDMSQLILLSRHLESLHEKVQSREFEVVKAREELNACRLKISSLEDEQQNVEEEIEMMKNIGNMASSYRLISRGEKLTTEVLLERKVESVIKANLKMAELALSEVSLEHGHYVDLSAKVEQQKTWAENHRQKMAGLRLQKEKLAASKERKHFAKIERDYQQQIEDAECSYVEKMETALINNVKARKFLKISLERLKQNQAKDNQREKYLSEKRMRSIIELKKNINLNQENLRALQARNNAVQTKSKAAEEEERLRVLNEGGNPDQVILQRKSLKKQEVSKRAFTKKQKDAELNIVDKILTEEQRLKQRKKQQPQLWPISSTDHRKKMAALKKKKRPVTDRLTLDDNDLPIFIDDKVTKISATPLNKKHETHQSEEILEYYTDSVDENDDDAMSSRASIDGRLRALMATQSEIPQKQDLAQPEFDGLWTKKHKNYETPKDSSSNRKPVGGSNMECDILQKTLKRHRNGITIKQVAAGREFTGQPFYSNPDVIHFKDFDVGKSYQKKIVITNVSYTMNFCKFIGVSEHLKDFITVGFKPPGQMSAGMSCDMHVTFKPKINQDLEGQVKFMAQTGAFSLPLKCSTKKCDLQLDADFIDFGSQVVGETICRSVHLINKGALGTRFEFFKVPDKPATTYTTETSLGRLTTSETVAMTPVDESDFVKTATTYPQETNTKQQRRQTTKEGHSTAAFTFSRQSETPGLPYTEENERIREMTVDIIEETTDTERDMMRSEADEIKFASTVTEYSMLPEEIKVGQTMSGEIAAFSSVRLDVIFAPTIPGSIKANFRIAFSDKDSQPITVKTSAKATDVPVWIEKQTVDLKICMYDRLYQDQLIVRNRATTALRLNFEVPKELKNHVELLPKTGYIQAQSTFTAQLKFLPRKNLAEEAAGLFDPETKILEAPMVIHVADQTRPVPFTVTAIVTLSTLEFEHDEIDFGECGIYESVTSKIRLTSHSILPQVFGFVDIPDYVEVQPNDGFGTILPLETIELDIIASVPKARVYDFRLVCKNSIGNEFAIRCKAVGVHPPMELTKQVINFAATALGDTSCAYLHVVNSHISANEFTHPVPRIGKGDIVPVGPTSFEFSIPKDAPISITPTVGTVKPGEKCLITVHFNPSLPENEIREEAVRVLNVQREDSKKREEEEQQAREHAVVSLKVEDDKTGKGKKSKTPARTKTGDSGHPRSGKSDGRKSTSEPESIPTPDEIEKDSVAFKAAIASLTRCHTGSFESFKVPCFIASGKCDAFSEPPSKLYSPANVLYVDIHCPTVKPPVVVISNHGHSRTEFGQVSIGQNTIKAISIQNISDCSVDLTLSSLDTNGPFQVLNALRTLKPDETHSLLVSFTPNAGKLSYEVLKVISDTSVLNIPLTGEGVSPVINISVTDGLLDMDHVLVGESISSVFTLSNSSSLKVDYGVRLDSCSLLRHSLSQQFPGYVKKSLKEKGNSAMLAGSQNIDGASVFDCVPCEGTIATGESQEITVTFKPDHSSPHFSDGIRIVLFNSEEAHKFRLCGQADNHMMYLSGYEPLDVGMESLTMEQKPVSESETDASQTSETVLLMFQSKIDGIAFPAVNRQIIVGCLRTNAFVAKKNGEWLLENVQHAQSVGFSFDQLKGTVDVGVTKPIDITWNPPEGHDPKIPVESTITVTLKADVSLTYNLLLRALLILH